MPASFSTAVGSRDKRGEEDLLDDLAVVLLGRQHLRDAVVRGPSSASPTTDR
jgi:hypothetical protein